MLVRTCEPLLFVSTGSSKPLWRTEYVQSKKRLSKKVKGRVGGLDDPGSSVSELHHPQEMSTVLPSAAVSNAAAVQRPAVCSSLANILRLKLASPFWREARVHVRRSSGRPEASTSVITWRKLGENLRCRNGSRKRLTWAKLHLNLTMQGWFLHHSKLG